MPEDFRYLDDMEMRLYDYEQKAAQDAETPECPFCHQKLLYIGPDEDPRMHCKCPDALRHQTRRNNYERTLGLLQRAFGEECAEQNPAWKPADPETMLHLQRCVEFVTLGGHDKIVISMHDGSKAEVSAGTVKRKIGFEMKVEV